MRVLCIDAKPRTNSFNNEIASLVENEYYHVIGEYEGHDVNGVAGMGYELAELPSVGYAADRFIPVSDIDETEDEGYKRREIHRQLILPVRYADIENAYDEALRNIGPMSHFNCRCTVAHCMEDFNRAMREARIAITALGAIFDANRKILLRTGRNKRRHELRKLKLSFTK